MTSLIMLYTSVFDEIIYYKQGYLCEAPQVLLLGYSPCHPHTPSSLEAHPILPYLLPFLVILILESFTHYPCSVKILASYI